MTHSPKQTPWTPGPWEYYPANNYAGFAIAPLGTLPTLAAVERPKGCSNIINVTAFNFPGETEANARLMAASPELYDNGDFLADRLEDFQNSLEAGDVDDAIRDWHGHVVPALARFRAALSKARPSNGGEA